MADAKTLAAEFEGHRTHLRAIAYRLLGSSGEADDAVQETWVRLERAGPEGIDNLRAWLTTVLGRVCIDMLRARSARREDPLDTHVPDPVVTDWNTDQPDDVILGESVGLALLIVLETLDPAERLAFVLHDVFGMPFEEIAQIVNRSPVAARKLASRARQRVRSGSPPPAPRSEQRRVAEAFLDAARNGNFEGLLALLDPDIVLRADGGALSNASRVVRGAAAVLEQAQMFSRGLTSEIVLVNGNVGFLARRADGRPFSVVALTVADGRIHRMDILADPERMARLDLTSINTQPVEREDP